MNIQDAKKAVCEAGKKLLQQDLVKGTWGNVSLRYDDQYMIITPSGLSYEELRANDMVVVNYHTYKYEGIHKPSSEMKLHGKIYKTRKKVNAVIHTHQQNASTVAAARREIPPILDDMAQILGPTVRVAEYALPGTKKIVKATLKALKGRNAALMANHGAVVVGSDMEEAFIAAEVLEKTAKAFIEASFLGEAKGINKFEAWYMHQYYLRKYGKQKKR
ncbi:MAG: class II aldolase/adducin family protein [Bacteroidales bacterium]|nr:class II aldolase/adducin family protein [Bacteroidales bacterium]